MALWWDVASAASAPEGPVSLTLDRVARTLRSPERWTYEGDVRWRAAVAVILRERDGALEVLVIRRAERAGDRWSGHAALPGGKVSESDTSIDDTALRETLEEVGLDLRAIGHAASQFGNHIQRAPGVIGRSRPGGGQKTGDAVLRIKARHRVQRGG